MSSLVEPGAVLYPRDLERKVSVMLVLCVLGRCTDMSRMFRCIVMMDGEIFDNVLDPQQRVSVG